MDLFHGWIHEAVNHSHSQGIYLHQFGTVVLLARSMTMGYLQVPPHISPLDPILNFVFWSRVYWEFHVTFVVYLFFLSLCILGTLHLMQVEPRVFVPYIEVVNKLVRLDSPRLLILCRIRLCIRLWLVAYWCGVWVFNVGCFRSAMTFFLQLKMLQNGGIITGGQYSW